MRYLSPDQAKQITGILKRKFGKRHFGTFEAMQHLDSSLFSAQHFYELQDMGVLKRIKNKWRLV